MNVTELPTGEPSVTGTLAPTASVDRDAGAERQGGRLAHGEVAREDVAEVGRGLRADALSATLWPLVRVSGWMSIVLELQVVAGGPPERYCTSMAGMYSGRSKALPTRSPALNTAPTFRLT